MLSLICVHGDGMETHVVYTMELYVYCVLPYSIASREDSSIKWHPTENVMILFFYFKKTLCMEINAYGCSVRVYRL